MGDRTGLTKLDRTNGYDDSRDYMRVKKSKLAQQNDQIREALRSRNSSSKTDLFKGISINVNGRTQPTADELKRLILLNGGDYHPYYRYQTTKFMIATNLSTARMKQLRPDDRVVRPEWITESIQAKCVLPYQDYQLFVEEPRGKTGSVLAIESSGATTSNQPETVVESYRRNYRKSKGKQEHPVTKSKDIREMFSRATRGPTATSSKKVDDLNFSRLFDNTDSSNSNSIFSQSSQSREAKDIVDSCNGTLTKQSSRSMTMADFVVRGAKNNCFPKPKVANQTDSTTFRANICGLSNLDDVIALLNEWVGCPEGIKDEDTACVTKFFYDLMSEKGFHNKFYEIVDAFQQRVTEYNDKDWIILYNDLVSTLKEELNQNIEASKNLYQLITLIDLSGDADSPIKQSDVESSNRASGEEETVTQRLAREIPVIDLD